MKTNVNRNLALLFSGQFISQIGDKFYALALAFWVLKATGSPERMGIVLFAAMVPSILLGFVLGGVLDRWNRKVILITADLVRGTSVVGITVLYFSGALNLTSILVTQVILSAASAFFNPTLSAVLPSIVEKDHLIRANATSQMLSGVADILGPVFGGLAVAWGGYTFVFLFNAASFFACAALNFGLRLPRTSEDYSQKAALPALAATYRFLWGDKRLLTILGIVALVHCFAGSISIMTPVLANSLQGNGAQNLGYLETCLGVGTVLCAFIIHRTNLRKREELFMFGGIGGIGIALMLAGGLSLAGVTILLPYFIALPILSSSIIVVATSYTVIVQKTVTGDIAGGVFSVISSVGNLSLPISMLLFGFLLERAAWGIVALGCGITVVIIALVLLGLYMLSGRKSHKTGE